MCFGCRQHGHFQRGFEFSHDSAAKKAEVPQHERSFESQAAPLRRIAFTNDSAMRDPRIEILVGDKPCFTCIDSGADTTVMRANEVSAEIFGQSSDRIRLTGVFRHGVTARLTYVALGLPHLSGSATQHVTLLSTVTDQLTTCASALFTPADYECLRHCQQGLLNDLKDELCSTGNGTGTVFIDERARACVSMLCCVFQLRWVQVNNMHFQIQERSLLLFLPGPSTNPF